LLDLSELARDLSRTVDAVRGGTAAQRASTNGRLWPFRDLLARGETDPEAVYQMAGQIRFDNQCAFCQ